MLLDVGGCWWICWMFMGAGGFVGCWCVLVPLELFGHWLLLGVVGCRCVLFVLMGVVLC